MKHFDEEEAFHEKEKKAFRKERKILSKKDRSKYKKTDQDKLKKIPPKGEHLKDGRVLAIMADGILVDWDDTLYTCMLRGSLKKHQTRIKNLIAVGDRVLFEPLDHQQGSIVYVHERHSILSRAGALTHKKEQLIAVNIDQVLITAAVISPQLKPNLIDRYIIAALKGNMDPIIVINKIDLLEESPKERAFFNEVVEMYQNLHIPLFAVSAKAEQGIEELKEIMKGKSSVFSGQSGSGKTSLINLIIGSSFLTGEVVAKTGKGSHTTTTTRLLPIEGDGLCVDTPGIKSFGMWNLKQAEVQHYYTEIAHFAQDCKFFNCQHLHEPKCAVKKAVEEGKISRLRFDSYCALIASLKENLKR